MRPCMHAHTHTHTHTHTPPPPPPTHTHTTNTCITGDGLTTDKYAEEVHFWVHPFVNILLVLLFCQYLEYLSIHFSQLTVHTSPLTIHLFVSILLVLLFCQYDYHKYLLIYISHLHTAYTNHILQHILLTCCYCSAIIMETFYFMSVCAQHTQTTSKS